eukprot:Clim_evm5s175 gene=Clim_evmTU5s175
MVLDIEELGSAVQENGQKETNDTVVAKEEESSSSPRRIRRPKKDPSSVPSADFHGPLWDVLSEEKREIVKLNDQACTDKQAMYKDPASGYMVISHWFHHKRGNCCGNGCRHCPYHLERAPQPIQDMKHWNGFYWDNKET